MQTETTNAIPNWDGHPVLNNQSLGATWWSLNLKTGLIERQDRSGATIARAEPINGILRKIEIRDGRRQDGSLVVNKDGSVVRFISLHLDTCNDGPVRVDVGFGIGSAISYARALPLIRPGEMMAVGLRRSGRSNSSGGEIIYINIARRGADGEPEWILHSHTDRVEDVAAAEAIIRAHPAFVASATAQPAGAACRYSGSGYQRLMDCLMDGWVGPDDEPAAWAAWLGSALRRPIEHLDDVADHEWSDIAHMLEGRERMPRTLREDIERRRAERAAAAAKAGPAPADEYDPFAED